MEVGSWKMSWVAFGCAVALQLDLGTGFFGRTHVLLRSASLENMRRRRCASDMQYLLYYSIDGMNCRVNVEKTAFWSEEGTKLIP